ncbi:MAG: hypothetical protein R3349_10460, partial [Geminicoccaceae bacterium]|nr:hypothetical protein [Geminicoccaceae bacterium]
TRASFARRRSTAWRDGLFLVLACAGVARAAHAAGPPDQVAGRLLDGAVLATLAPATLVDLTLPILLAAAALLGPAILRCRWQIGVLALGAGWIGLVGLALLQERTLGQSFDALSGAAGLAGLVAVALLLKPGTRREAAPAEAAVAAQRSAEAPA